MDIEELGLDLEMKTFNRLKKAGINTVDELLAKMYTPGSKVSQPDAKRCEYALKTAGIIKFMRGDEVDESDIEPEPLTWDELHSYIGRLVVKDCSTESHRWLVVCWIYDISDEGEGRVTYISNSREYCYSDRSTVNGGYSSLRCPSLKHEGQFFTLKSERKGTTAMIAPQMKTPPADVSTAVTDKYTEAYNLNVRICVNAQAAQESLYEMCKALKEMHDQKLYRELGYSSFEDYTEKEVGIKRVQAYKYVAIGSIENVHSSEQIGVTKLALLAKLDEQERTEIVQNTDLESTSVRELKAKISELERDLKTQQDNYSMHTKRREDEIAKLQSSNAMLQDNIVNEQNKSIQLQSQLDSMTADRDQEKEWREELVTENGKQSNRISELIAQVDELENRPVDVLIHNNDEEIDRLTAQFQEELKKRDKDTEQRLEQQREKYLKQMNEGIAKAREEAQAPDLHELWRALDNSLDNAIEAIEDFFDDYEDHPKIKDFASCLKTTIRDLNKLMNDVLAGEK